MKVKKGTVASEQDISFEAKYSIGFISDFLHNYVCILKFCYNLDNNRKKTLLDRIIYLLS
jgi:hypothetical protein